MRAGLKGTDFTVMRAESKQLFQWQKEARPAWQFKRRLYDLYYCGYTIAEVWRMYAFSRTPHTRKTYATIRLWIKEGERLPPLPDTIKPPEVPVCPPDHRLPDSRRAAIRRVYPQVPPAQREAFADLARQTRTLRGTTAEDSAVWRKRQEFHNCIRLFYLRGVRISDIAKVAGVTHRAIRHRLTEMGELK